MLKKLFKRMDDAHEFKPILLEIEDAPVSPIGRTMFWTVVILFVCTILWLVLGQVDIVVTTRGQIIPDGNIKVIQPLDTGVITNIFVKEGSFVKKGQILMEIDPSTTAPRLDAMKKNLDYIQLESQRLDASSQGVRFVPPTATGEKLPDVYSINTQTQLYNSSMDSMQKQLDVKELELKKVDEQIKSTLASRSNNLNQLTILKDKERRLNAVINIIAKNEVDQCHSDILNLQSQIKEADFKLDELHHQRNQALEEQSYIRANFKAENLKELSDKQKNSTDLISQIKEATYKNTKQRIISPVDGYINTLSVHTVGGVVTSAEKLMSIVPINTPLVIKATAENRDIGFIHEGMPVALKIDTFDFQKYGILKGKVKSISEDSIQDPKAGLIYEVYITPIDKSLMVESKKVYLKTGMSLSAEIKVGKRRIIEFFIYPLIKYLNEGMSVR
ncbi:MAG: HlyD family type I secretion periplasmic adaptor subunit [bacterium]